MRPRWTYKRLMAMKRARRVLEALLGWAAVIAWWLDAILTFYYGIWHNP